MHLGSKNHISIASTGKLCLSQHHDIVLLSSCLAPNSNHVLTHPGLRQYNVFSVLKKYS